MGSFWSRQMPGERGMRGVVRSGMPWAEEIRAGLARVAIPGYYNTGVTVLALGKPACHSI